MQVMLKRDTIILLLKKMKNGINLMINSLEKATMKKLNNRDLEGRIKILQINLNFKNLKMLIFYFMKSKLLRFSILKNKSMYQSKQKKWMFRFPYRTINRIFQIS